VFYQLTIDAVVVVYNNVQNVQFMGERFSDIPSQSDKNSRWVVEYLKPFSMSFY